MFSLHGHMVLSHLNVLSSRMVIGLAMVMAGPGDANGQLLNSRLQSF